MANSLEFKIHSHASIMHDPELTPIQDFANGLLSASLARSIMYPVDVAQVLLQTNSNDARDGVIATLVHLYNTYGLTSLWRGNIASCSIGTTLALGSFLGASPAFRNVATTPISQFLVKAALTTAIFPLQIAKIRMITHPEKYKSTMQTIETIYKEEELPTLYKGLPVTILGFLLNGISTAAAYRIIDAIWNKRKKDMTWWEGVVYAALAAMLAGLVEYPIDTAVKIVQATPNDTDNVLRVLLNTGKIPRAGGIRALFKGFSVEFIKPLGIPLQAKIADITRQLFAGKKG
jgi:hypothetical protein